MDKTKCTRSNELEHFNKLINFLKQITKLSNSERLRYIDKFTNEELNYISEIVLNFLNNKLKTGFIEFNTLKNTRKELHSLVSKSKSYRLKRKLLKTLKGLNILNILLPLALNTLTK